MTSPAGSWRISQIANEARKAIESLDLETQEHVLTRLQSLQMDPFAGDIKKIRGKTDLYRLRVQSLRIYFRLNMPKKSIDIVLIDKRGQLKERSIKRL